MRKGASLSKDAQMWGWRLCRVRTPTLLLRFFLSFLLPLLLDLWWPESDDDELEDLERDGDEEERQTQRWSTSP